MGLALGTPCCGCRVIRWRIAMSANHGFYGTRIPKELLIVGDGNGFDWSPVYEGDPFTSIGIYTFLKLENQGVNDWRLHVEQNGIGSTFADFTHDFTTGLHDVEVTFAVNDNIKQVITIMDYDDARPSDFIWFPNRSPEDTIRLVLTKYEDAPQARTPYTSLMTRSSDANFVYWDATLDGDTITIHADKQTGKVKIEHSTYGMGIDARYVAWPFHISLFNFGPGEIATGLPDYDGFDFDENDPPIVESY